MITNRFPLNCFEPKYVNNIKKKEGMNNLHPLFQKSSFEISEQLLLLQFSELCQQTEQQPLNPGELSPFQQQ